MESHFFTEPEIKFDFLFRSILKTNCRSASFHVTPPQLPAHLGVFAKLKTALPDLTIHLHTDTCLFRSFSKALRTEVISSVCFNVSASDFLKLQNDSVRAAAMKRVFLSADSFEYKSFLAESPQENELLFVLMPAWNNDFPPYGLAHLASAVSPLKLNFEILDLNNSFWRKLREGPSVLDTYKNVLNWAHKSLYTEYLSPELNFLFDNLKAKVTAKTKYVGFSLFYTNLNASEEAMTLLRKLNPQIKIFCGGPECTETWAKSAIERGLIDAAVIGEGEATTLELLRGWEQGDLPMDFAGAVINRNQVAVTGPSRPLMDINSLPKPDFTKFPLYTYDTLAFPIFTSRGCVAKCSFCAETIYWKKFRALHPERVVAMMQEQMTQFGINTFHFNDSLMNGSHQLLEDTCDLIIEKNLDVEFKGYSRFDKKMTPEILQKMAKAGCKSIAFGFESGSQKVVDLMNKKVFVDNYDGILTNATAAGINCLVCIIVGFPGETWKDFFSTLIKVVKMRKIIHEINLSIMEISKSSLIEKDFAKYGIINNEIGRYWRTKNWTNFYLLRVARHLIFKITWRIVRGKGVSVQNWNPGYIMLFKKIAQRIRARAFSRV